jgi:hypothetical protein
VCPERNWCAPSGPLIITPLLEVALSARVVDIGFTENVISVNLLLFLSYTYLKCVDELYVFSWWGGLTKTFDVEL